MISASSWIVDGVRWIRFRGRADDQGLVAAFRALWTDDAYTADLPEIYDLRRFDAVDISLLAAAQLSRLNQQLHGQGPMVQVALLLETSLQRALAAQVIPRNRYRGANIQICTDEPSAIAWVSNTPFSQTASS